MDVVIDCAGVGYSVAVPTSSMERLPSLGDEVLLHTILNVREDALSLFGFVTTAERHAFILLTSVNGIGARTALGILSSASIGELSDRIMRNDLPALQRLPGVGKKTAERLVVELRDKFAVGAHNVSTTTETVSSGRTEEATAAMVSLGYSRAAAEKAVRSVLAANPDAANSTESLVRLALRLAGS